MSIYQFNKVLLGGRVNCRFYLDFDSILAHILGTDRYLSFILSKFDCVLNKVGYNLFNSSFIVINENLIQFQIPTNTRHDTEKQNNSKTKDPRKTEPMSQNISVMQHKLKIKSNFKSTAFKLRKSQNQMLVNCEEIYSCKSTEFVTLK